MRAVVTSISVVACLAAATPSAAEPEDLRITKVATATVELFGVTGPVVWRSSCQLFAVQEDFATGMNYEGVLAGGTVAVNTLTGRPVPMPSRCFVRVNSAEADTTESTQVFAERATFGAGDTDSLMLCAEMSPGAADCAESTRSQLPAQAVYELIIDLSRTADPALCSTLTLVRGVPGYVDIDDTGDLKVLQSRKWDCPTYDD